MEQRRVGGGNGFGAEMSGSLNRRKKRREQRGQRMQGFRGLQDYARQQEDSREERYDPEEFGYGSQETPDFEQPEVPGNSEFGQAQGNSDFGNEQGQGQGLGGMMNSGGEDLPPQDRNPFSPTAGQGFNLNNMLRRKRREYF